MRYKVDRGKQAFRSGYQITEQPDLEETSEDIKEIESQEDRDNANYASLKGHPGWELIKKDFEQTISSYRSGQAIKGAIAQSKTNTEIGELVRTSNAIADELEKIVLTVEGAAIAIEDGKRGA